MNSRVVVAPLSRANIEKFANAVRAALGISLFDRVDMLRLIELVLPVHLEGFRYEIVPDRDLGDAEATTSTTERLIRISQSCYDSARGGHARYPFTLAHEFGHLMLHTGKSASLARGEVKAFVDPEWQADNFAGAFLAPAEMVQVCTSISELMRRSGLSRDAADVRLRVLKTALPFLPASLTNKGC
ncbi:ImmA/IrrE family metallo-endopeptidase [Sphingomonas sp. NFR15]|uniref:ImmA/IrrE family metallo-endopeptidase n=1 Tax=Sphingomonas sp. NFR15 TaxID=1566282 RepID=UPI000B80C63C|nr:ImmA/IrrE family metallo-endopeptidase [Sphingomonas sp. NFR15]